MFPLRQQYVGKAERLWLPRLFVGSHRQWPMPRRLIYMPLTANNPTGAPMPLAADEPRYGAPLPQYQPRYDDNRPPLPFPFFFGR
jgi:hypothetical protein